MKNLILAGISLALVSCSSNKILFNKNYRTSETLIVVQNDNQSNSITKSEQFIENDSMIISFRNEFPQFELNLVKDSINEIHPKFYIWHNYGEISRREYYVKFEKLKLILNTNKLDVGDFIYGEINAVSMPININGKVTRYKVNGHFTHKVLEVKSF